MVTVPHRIELLPPLVVIILLSLRIHNTKNTILTAESQLSTQISLSEVFEHRKIRFKEFCDSKQDIVEECFEENNIIKREQTKSCRYPKFYLKNMDKKLAACVSPKTGLSSFAEILYRMNLQGTQKQLPTGVRINIPAQLPLKNFDIYTSVTKNHVGQAAGGSSFKQKQAEISELTRTSSSKFEYRVLTTRHPFTRLYSSWKEHTKIVPISEHPVFSSNKYTKITEALLIHLDKKPAGKTKLSVSPIERIKTSRVLKTMWIGLNPENHSDHTIYSPVGHQWKRFPGLEVEDWDWVGKHVVSS